MSVTAHNASAEAEHLASWMPPDPGRYVVVSSRAEAIATLFQEFQPDSDVRRVEPGVAPVAIRELPGESVDAVLYDALLGSPEHLDRIIEAIDRCLKPGGQFLISWPNPSHWSVIVALLRGEPPPYALNGLGLETIVGRLQAAGLEVFGIEPEPGGADDLETFVHSLAPTLRLLDTPHDEFVIRTQIRSQVIRARKCGPPTRPILIQTLIGESIACARPRIHEPHRFLATVPGIRIVSTEGSAQILSGLDGIEKIFIRQRLILKTQQDLDAQRALIQAGYLIVAEFDDDPGRFPEIAAHAHWTFSACHAVQTSTEALADLIRPWNPHVEVFPNQIRRIAPPRSRPAAAPVRLFFGALNREDDWAPLVAPLNRLALEFGDRITFQVVYDRSFFDALHSPHKTFEPLCPFPRYAELLSQSEVAILPLSPTRFNACKSDLKFIECASMGVVAVAGTTVYSKTIEHGRTGFLCETPEDYESNLRQILGSPRLRQGVAARAWNYVRTHRLLSNHYRDRLNWYTGLVENRAELNRELRDRMGWR